MGVQGSAREFRKRAHPRLIYTFVTQRNGGRCCQEACISSGGGEIRSADWRGAGWAAEVGGEVFFLRSVSILCWRFVCRV